MMMMTNTATEKTDTTRKVNQGLVEYFKRKQDGA